MDLGEKILVAGYPHGEMFSNSIKVTGGMVSANRGLGDDIGQFQMDAAVQPGNSGGPIYDEKNIVGVVVAQLNKMKFAKKAGSLRECELWDQGIHRKTVLYRQVSLRSGRNGPRPCPPENSQRLPDYRPSWSCVIGEIDHQTLPF